MQVYETKVIQELDNATNELTKSVQKEAKMITFAGTCYGYKMIAIAGMIILAAGTDRPLLRFVVPMAVLALIFIFDILLSSMKWHLWKERNEKERVYFEKSRAVSDYNTHQLLQVMGSTEIANSIAAEIAGEVRVIN